MRVEHFTRQARFWLYVALDRPEDLLDLASIGCRILVAEIYNKVTFELN